MAGIVLARFRSKRLQSSVLLSWAVLTLQAAFQQLQQYQADASFAVAGCGPVWAVCAVQDAEVLQELSSGVAECIKNVPCLHPVPLSQ